MRVDLHSHTNYSDGVLSVEELVVRAKNNGLDAFALTDHDTISGVDLAVECGKKYGIKVLKGIELSTKYKGENVHIVGLFKNNIVPKEIIDYSISSKERRTKRAIIMMKKISEYYNVKIDLNELSLANSITRKNMHDHILKHNNLTVDEVKPMTSRKSPCYIPSTNLSTEDGLKMLKNAGCFAIFAHPCLIDSKENLLELVKMDFDAIEVYYANPKNDVEYMKKLADENKLLYSAGSDCHGDSSHADIGTVYLNEEEVKPIFDYLGLKIE